MSDMVGTPEDRFSPTAAHVRKHILYNISSWSLESAILTDRIALHLETGQKQVKAFQKSYSFFQLFYFCLCIKRSTFNNTLLIITLL